MFESLPDIASTGAKAVTGELEFQVLTSHFTHLKDFQDTDSLTTPCCIEGVDWYLSDAALSCDMKGYSTVKKRRNDIQRARYTLG
ncbi:hypothetical protein BDV38DRAFT_231586 [Aspergillus pseudotamarii]|uniref:Uncharacterized protein n=1 Tax=Aspergillus pseudotamarii TaxID=132259 RepID=A0A5N6TAW5_ASPPS|nr:uncharacterized protein BDV38DRAFT_231586 [Aspergillus pseudotamarii]KAE8143528.1 hypothetical protein BDV38DRAFT_231586 [Aspergillus pseudotamarii]